MKIFVIDTRNNQEMIEINENDFVKDIEDKLRIRKKIKGRIHLHFNGDILEENEKISSYDIQDNDRIIFLGNFIKKSINIFIVDSRNNQEMIEINENFVKDIAEKLRIRKKIKGRIHLHFNGNILEENEKISSYDIQDNDRIIFVGNFKGT